MAEPIATEFTQNLMASHPDIQEFLDELVVFEAYHLRTDVPNLRHDAAVSCGISLVRPGRAVTVASSDSFAEQLDQAQYDVNDGPCLQALHSGEAQLAADLEVETRWPRYREAVQPLGLRSVMGLPLPLEHDARAAMNVYSTTPNAFDDMTVEAATTMTRQAARALVLAIRVAYRGENAENLHGVLQSRITTDVAVGILMGQQRCTQDVAFETLRSAATSRNISLRDVAAGIVDSVGDRPQGEPTG